MGIEQIIQLLPHRYPFLFIDRVTKYKKNKIECRKNVTINEPYFQGHFNQNPIMPGVLMIECAAQTAALMYILDEMNYEALKATEVSELCSSGELAKMVGYIAGVKGFKFTKIVRPGDCLVITCMKTYEMNNLSEVTVNICDENQQSICKGKIMVSKNES